LNFHSSAASHAVNGGYMKWLRCGFKGAPATGSTKTLVVGTNNFTPGCHDSLFEECYAFGLGGRYKIQLYNCQRVVLRRCLARHDGGWTWDGQNPQGMIVVYDCDDCAVQNCIAIDAVAGLTSYEGNFYFPTAGTTALTQSGHTFEGNITVGPGKAFQYSGNSNGGALTVNDFVAHGADLSGCVMNGSGTKSCTVNRATIIGISASSAFAEFNTGSYTVKNTIIEDCNDAIGTGDITAEATCRGWNNAGGNDGLTQLDPEANGLSYPPRIEAASVLKTAGEGGGQIGAEIEFKRGVDETLHGETDWNTLTANALWPFPNEARIRTDLKDVRDVGFCVNGETLTNYIHNLLGNGNPY